MPNQRMNSGTQAIEGMARNACTVGSSRRRDSGTAPVNAPSTVPAATPNGEARCDAPQRHENVGPQLAGGGKLGQRLEYA